MNTRLLFVFILMLLSTCQKDDEFNVEFVPGEYTGALAYFTSLNSGGVGINITDLSKADAYKTTISKIGSNYILSFDKSFRYTIPDISVEITSPMNSKLVAIKTIAGQAYSSSGELTTYPNEPPNYFSIDQYVHRVDCNLTLKSNDPDSIYFLHLALLRIY